MIDGSKVGMVVDASDGPIFILSDIHAGALTPFKEQTAQTRLRKLSEHAARVGGRLIILGDLFDYWQESGNRTPKSLQTWVDLLDDIRNDRQPIILITGNHDHWAGPALANRGIVLVRDHVLVKTSDRPWLLLHGDGLPVDSLLLHRKGLNKKFRSPVANRFFRLLPLSVRVSIMRAFSVYRKERGHDHAENAFILGHLKQWLSRHDFAGLAFGHTHERGQWNIEGKHLVNTGTFYTDGCVMVLNDSTHSLADVDALLSA